MKKKRGVAKGDKNFFFKKVPNEDLSEEIRVVATILDECETEGQREEYVKALQKHASVHIYGRCGAPCPGWVTEDCLRYLDKHYKVRHEKSIIFRYNHEVIYISVPLWYTYLYITFIVDKYVQNVSGNSSSCTIRLSTLSAIICGSFLSEFFFSFVKI